MTLVSPPPDTAPPVEPQRLRELVEQAMRVLESLSTSCLAVLPAVDRAAQGTDEDAGETRTIPTSRGDPPTAEVVEAKAGKAASAAVPLSSSAHALAETASVLAQLPVSARRAGFLTQATHIKRLVEMYAQQSRSSTAQALADGVSDVTRASLNGRALDQQCAQQCHLPLSSAPTPASTTRAQQLAPLSLVREQFAALRAASVAGATAADAPLTFVTPASLTKASPSPPPSPPVCESRAPALVSLVESVLACGQAACEGFSPPSPALQLDNDADDGAPLPSRPLPAQTSVLVRDLARWLTPYVNLTSTVLRRPTLEAATESGCEQLRRMSFDVVALQHQQEQAIVDGDMKKSEGVYLEQVQLLETMEGVFTHLEDVLNDYREQWVHRTRGTLTQVQQEWATSLAPVLEATLEHRQALVSDVAALQHHVEAVRRAREAQKVSLSQYHTEWVQHYQRNVKAHDAVFQAMEELERRMRWLDEEQRFLVSDRLDVISAEQARASDEALFRAYAEARATALADASLSTEALLLGLQTYERGAHDSADHLQQYLDEGVEARVADAMLDLQKARLSQFQQLYLTLGDLSFKKARHAEEVHKKVAFYALQQEVAMDTFNPKAKTFSRARQQWESVYTEVQEQLEALQSESQRKLKDFEPTERFLIEAGVPFRSPQDELVERNAVRQQKLLDYQKLMDKTTHTSSQRGSGSGGEAVPRQITAHGSARRGSSARTPPHSAAAARAESGWCAEDGAETRSMNDTLDQELKSLHVTHTRASKGSLEEL